MLEWKVKEYTKDGLFPVSSENCPHDARRFMLHLEKKNPGIKLSLFFEPNISTKIQERL
jgi:hypothetical protein